MNPENFPVDREEKHEIRLLLQHFTSSNKLDTLYQGFSQKVREAHVE